MKIKAALLALALILLFSITPLFVNTASATALREFSGEAGSYSGEYKISTAESLNALAAAVNAGNNMSGVTFYLENDIALNSALEFNENGYVS